MPLTAEVSLADLPRHVRPIAELSTLGSAYVRVSTPALGSEELRVWLKAELGPLWSLTAVRLAADGHELGRTSAPPRRVPSSYLPVALDPETASVLLVVINLSEPTPDADRPAPSPHSYELVLARGHN